MKTPQDCKIQLDRECYDALALVEPPKGWVGLTLQPLEKPDACDLPSDRFVVVEARPVVATMAFTGDGCYRDLFVHGLKYLVAMPLRDGTGRWLHALYWLDGKASDKTRMVLTSEGPFTYAVPARTKASGSRSAHKLVT